jgi:hypothetical protein
MAATEGDVCSTPKSGHRLQHVLGGCFISAAAASRASSRYSITSSARANNVGRTTKPSAFAVSSNQYAGRGALHVG